MITPASVIAKILEPIGIALDIYIEKARKRTLRNFRRLLRANEKKLIPIVREWMQGQNKEAVKGLSHVKRYTKKNARTTARKLTDWDAIKADATILIKPHLLAILAEGGKAVVDRQVLKQEERFDPIGVSAVAWAKKHSAKLVTEVTDETIKGIAAYISDSVDKGRTVPEISMALREKVGLTTKQIMAVANYEEWLIVNRPEYSAKVIREMADVHARRLHRYRAAMIARTETANALKEGTLQGYEQFGIKNVTGVSDPECCDWCAENISGKTYSMAEAREIDASTHPQCECGWAMG